MEFVLRERGFDVAGVQENERAPVLGFVMRDALRNGIVKDHAKPMTAEHLVSDATPLGHLLTLLRTRERVFVLLGSEVRGIITLADLNKPPVRVYLFGLTSLLEMHLGFWVAKSYGEDSWKDKLKTERLEAASDLQSKRNARNEEITLLDCLQFCDKRDLVLAKSDLRTKLGLGGKKKAESVLRLAEDLRNRLAHSQHDLVQGTSWPALIEVIENLEALVHKSDDAVEQMAKSSSRNSNALWVVG
jgi:hypothetical protein